MARDLAQFASQADLAALSEKVSEMRDHQDGMNDTIAGLMTLTETVNAWTRTVDDLRGTVDALVTENEALRTSLAELTDELRGALNGYEEPEDGVPEDETDEQRATRVGLIVRLAEVEVLVRGRNRSAPTKRNMTDADAERVLRGDVKDLGHKEAGEQIGLTYAQVYSCRMEYTFKHIHKKLRDEGWKNPFVKG